MGGKTFSITGSLGPGGGMSGGQQGQHMQPNQQLQSQPPDEFDELTLEELQSLLDNFKVRI